MCLRECFIKWIDTSSLHVENVKKKKKKSKSHICRNYFSSRNINNRNKTGFFLNKLFKYSLVFRHKAPYIFSIDTA